MSGRPEISLQPGPAHQVRHRRGPLRLPVGARLQAGLQEALHPKAEVSKGQLLSMTPG